MPEVIEIQVEPLTDVGFAPFGQLIGPRDGGPDFHGQGIRSWRLNYDAVGATEVMYIWFDQIPMNFTRLERHIDVTQAFVPLGGGDMVMVVGPRTDENRPDDAPDPRQLHAFLVPGTYGVMMWKGVWHTLNRFPTRAPGAGFVLLTAKNTQAELKDQLQHGSLPTRTHVFDYAARSGIHFDINMNEEYPQR